MTDIKLKRGTREVTFKKLTDRFAVRLKRGRATSEKALSASCGYPEGEVNHVDSAGFENMDVFSVKEATKLEKTMDNLRTVPGSDVVSHVYALDDTSKSAVIPVGTMTIQFKPEVIESERERVLDQFGLEVVEDLDFLPHGYTVRLTEASKENPLKIAAKLQKHGDIVTAEPDLSFQVTHAHVPSDPLYRSQWHLNNRGDQFGLTEGADVKAEEAWDISRGSRDITVCVMDDGFDLDHPDFDVPGKIVAPRDFGEDDVDPSPVTSDDNHGTACAGVAIAEENGSGVVGLAPRCSFMPVRTSGWLSDRAIKDLFQYAIDHHADVISCSWTATGWNFPLPTVITGIIHKAATVGRRNGKGCVILFAAGNDDRPLDGAKEGQVSVQGFGLHPDVIAVAASNSRDRRSYYSNYGPELAICAPSSGAPGRGVVTTDRQGAGGYEPGDYTFGFGGTSSATPLAAGLAALILSVDPELTSAEVRQIVMETADKIDFENGQYVEGHSPRYGHGRINAQQALEMVVGRGERRRPESLYVEHRINKPIPDLGDVEDTITFPLDVNIKGLEVSVDIRHTWRGDLQVMLTPPRGEQIVLVDRTGGREDDVVQTFRSSDEPELFRRLQDTAAQGEWRLQVVDAAQQDVGVLNKWGVAVTYQ